jgi:hypothetical protein
LQDEHEDILCSGLHCENDNVNGTSPTKQSSDRASNDTDQNEKLCEEDIDKFLENEKAGVEEGNNDAVLESLKPEIGMTFKTREEGQNFFNTYSFAAGFSVAIVSAYRTTSKKRNNEIIRVTMKCNKYGKNSEEETDQMVAQRQSTVIAKTDCKVEMIISERGGIWTIKTLYLEHNHSLDPHSRFFRSHAYMTKEEKAMIRSLKQSNIPTRQIVSVLAHLRGGSDQLPYNKKKVSNYSTSINRELNNSDMMEVLSFFSKKQAEDPRFYSSFDLDSDNKVKSVFWADAKARSFYEMCGDCISFDTTFLTNKYNLPFAPIVGISPHGNTYLFACALIGNEKAETFRWVFLEFLSAMGGKHPQTIITDQDAAMQKAIQKVFPNTVHRSCLFHVTSKAEDHLHPTFRANEGLYEEFYDIINNSLTIEEFEMLWQQMVDMYQVGNLKHFQDLWASRKKWVPVYFKTNFLPFLQTTARSEGTNSLFKKGVGATYSMTSFLREYQRIMDSIHSKEAESEHNAIHKKVREKKFITKYYIERQAHDFYNIYIFRKFQKLLNDVTRLQIKEEKKEELYLVYQAKNYPIKEHRERVYVVEVEMSNDCYNCVCCKFQKDGLLCSHILKVMLYQNIERIPEKYFIDRWRKNHKRAIPKTPTEKVADNDTLRYNVLARKLVHTASKGSKSKRKYEFLLKEIDRIEDEMDKMDDQDEHVLREQTTSSRTVVNLTTTTTDENTNSTIELIDPDVANTKGRPRHLTIREAIKTNKFYKCSHCGSQSHTKKNCPNKHLQFDLPKTKKPRKSKKVAPGEYLISSSCPIN